MSDAARVGVVIPYFGPLPVYWPLTLHTMGLNREVTWHLVTDQDLGPTPPNVSVHPATFAHTRARVAATVGHDVALDDPYKLCDFKPAYGDVFAQELAPHEYWGYADVDLLWGDVWAHVGPHVEAGVSRIGTFGHLSLLRNTPELRRLYRREVPGIRSAREAFTTREHLSFDEFGGWNALTAAVGVDTVTEPLAFDMFVASYPLRANRSRRERPDSVFAWHEGRCLELDPATAAVRSEAAYVHLQKRAVRAPRTTSSTPRTLALGPVDIVEVTGLDEAVASVRSLTRSWSSWWHWRSSYDRFRLRRAARRVGREIRARRPMASASVTTTTAGAA